MKIAHISDIHWRGLARHAEYTKSFEMLFDQLKEIQPDIIVNTGDTFHTKTQGITPEVIERLSWMFRNLADIAPTYTLLGNHDGNLTNLNRKDIITPIHEAINHPRAFLLRDSGCYPVSDNIVLTAYSPFDKKHWGEVEIDSTKLNIALFHGSTSGCRFDNNWQLPEGEIEVADFTGFDFVLLGDIHKHQNMAFRVDVNNKPKPWMAYPGSLIQQNFGESEDKGFLVWDIKTRTDWEVEFHELPNIAPFVTVPWQGTVADTIDKIKSTREIVPGTRFRISSSHPVPAIQEQQLLNKLKIDHQAEDVIFKWDLISRMEDIETDSVKVNKKSLRNDKSAMFKLYQEYLKAHSDTFDLDEEQIAAAEKYINDYLTKLNNSTPETPGTSTWSLKWIEFDNLYRYGTGNRIDFQNLEGLIGIFGPNRIGKSSIVGAVMYALFNTTDRGPIKNIHLINKSKEYAQARIRFSVNGTDYIVERTTTRQKSKDDAYTGKVANSVHLFEIIPLDNGLEKKKVKNSISTTDTDKEIRRLIGTPEDFLLTAFASQGDLNRFILEGATNRKKHLARFLELDIFEKLYTYVKDDLTSLNRQTKNHSAVEWVNQIDSVTKKIESLESKLATHKESRDALRTKRDELKLWLSEHKKGADSIDLGALSAAARQVHEQEKEIESITVKITETKKRLKAEKRSIKAKKKFIDSNDKEAMETELAKLDEIDDKIRDLKHALELDNKKLERAEKSVKKLETVPCGDTFPSCRFIKDSHEDKKQIKSLRTEVKDATKTLDDLMKSIKKTRKRKLREDISHYFDCEIAIKLAEANVEKYEDKQVHLESDLAASKQTLKSLKKAEKEMQKKFDMLASEEYQKKEAALKKADSALSALEQEKATILQNLGSKKSELNRIMVEKAESQNLIDRINIYTSILNAFSKRGIPAMVLKTQLPAINLELSKILGNLIDFKIELETDVSSNVMDVYLCDQHSRRIVELCSGMEKTMCSLALRVALINLSSLPRPNFFFIDEGFGALDENNQQNCMNMLGLLSTYFKTVLVISHVTPVKEAADSIIEITNNGIESQVNA